MLNCNLFYDKIERFRDEYHSTSFSVLNNTDKFHFVFNMSNYDFIYVCFMTFILLFLA